MCSAQIRHTLCHLFDKVYCAPKFQKQRVLSQLKDYHQLRQLANSTPCDLDFKLSSGRVWIIKWIRLIGAGRFRTIYCFQLWLIKHLLQKSYVKRSIVTVLGSAHHESVHVEKMVWMFYCVWPMSGWQLPEHLKRRHYRIWWWTGCLLLICYFLIIKKDQQLMFLDLNQSLKDTVKRIFCINVLFHIEITFLNSTC